MASFECQLASLDKLQIDVRGIKEPLCNHCVNPDCDNPIRKQTINVFGIVKHWRLWVVNNTVRQVVQCVGYVSGDSDDTLASDPGREGTATTGTTG